MEGESELMGEVRGKDGNGLRNRLPTDSAAGSDHLVELGTRNRNRVTTSESVESRNLGVHSHHIVQTR